MGEVGKGIIVFKCGVDDSKEELEVVKVDVVKDVILDVEKDKV